MNIFSDSQTFLKQFVTTDSAPSMIIEKQDLLHKSISSQESTADF